MKSALAVSGLAIAVVALAYAFIQQAAAVKSRNEAVANAMEAQQQRVIYIKQLNKADSIQMLLDSCRAQK